MLPLMPQRPIGSEVTGGVRSVELAYGEGTIPLSVPESAFVVEPRGLPALSDLAGALHASLAPLGDLAGSARTVAIAFPDNTRPMPNHLVLPVLLAELEALGFGPEEVVLCCATGTHAAIDDTAMSDLVGPGIAQRYEIHQHSAQFSEHVEVGVVGDTPVLLDRRWVEADLRLTTGFVEPHFFAGFSGGPKGVCPGLAGLATILEAHSPERLRDSKATWLELDGNPVHEFVAQATALCPPTASLDVALSTEKQVAAIHFGPLPSSHRSMCEVVRQSAVVHAPHEFDIVVTTNSGMPLDRNLYQAVKGMAAGERCVAKGGEILMAASCVDGIPAGSPFAGFLDNARTPTELQSPGIVGEQDLWQIQVLGRVLERATVHLFSEGLSEQEIRTAQIEPVLDLQEKFDELCAAHGTDVRVAVLPQGPLSVVEVPEDK